MNTNSKEKEYNGNSHENEPSFDEEVENNEDWDAENGEKEDGREKEEDSEQQSREELEKYTKEIEEKNSSLEKQLELKMQQVEKLNEKIQRLQGDYDNLKRRSEKEKKELINRANSEFIKQLLSVLDNFERALLADSEKTGSLREGVEMIYKQFKELLETQGLEPVEAEGKQFDPNVHEAIMQVETDEYEDNTVMEEVQKGYYFKGKVLRPSMVKVACNK